MPKHCKECDDHYIVGRENKIVIRCMWCKGGAHDCIDRGNKEKLRGMFWMCRICSDLMYKQILPKITLVKKMELVKRETEINFEGFESKNDKVSEEIEEDSSKEDASQVRNRKGTIKEKEKHLQDKKKEKEAGSKEDNNENKICWFYENRKCKFGSQCRNLHPEACQRMMEYGKCSNSKCKLVHPKICRSYYDQGLCRRNNCWFTHPTKIENRNQDRTFTSDITHRNMYEHNSNNSRNNHHYQNQPIQSNQRNSNTNFLEIWPTPAEATSMNIQQTLTRLIGTIEKVDARVVNMELRQMNRWNC